MAKKKIWELTFRLFWDIAKAQITPVARWVWWSFPEIDLRRRRWTQSYRSSVEKKIILFRHQIGFFNKDVFAIAGAISEVGAYDTAAIDAADSVEALKKGKLTRRIWNRKFTRFIKDLFNCLTSNGAHVDTDSKFSWDFELHSDLQ